MARRPDPIAQRDLLAAQEESLIAEIAKLDAEERDLQQQLHNVEMSAVTEYAAAAASGTADTATLEPATSRGGLLLAIDQRRRARPVLQAALDQIPAQQAALTPDHWPTFEAEAARATAAAVEALTAAEGPYRRAYDAWSEATGTWNEATRLLEDAEHRDHGSGGGLRVRLGGDQTTRVPDWPGPPPSELFDGNAEPRPRGWTPPADRRDLERADLVEDVTTGNIEEASSARARNSGEPLCDTQGFGRYVRAT